MNIAVVDVQRLVGTYYGIPKAVFLGQSRVRSVSRPRQVAITLCREFTHASLPRIGRMFGGRDHTTCIHAIKAVDRLERELPAFANDLASLRSWLCCEAASRVAHVMCEEAWEEFESGDLT